MTVDLDLDLFKMSRSALPNVPKLNDPGTKLHPVYISGPGTMYQKLVAHAN